MQKSKILLAGLFLLPGIIWAQKNRRDKGEFVKAENRFYKKIVESLDNEQTNSNDRKVFKVNAEKIAVPEFEEFTTVWCNAPVSQGRTGTCWSFATSSFFEAEVFRLTQQKIDISEMYTVYWEYVEKATEFVRTRGKSFFGEGSETNALLRIMKKYGAVPYEAYPGKNPDLPFYDHQQMYNEMKQYLESVKATNAWNLEQVIGNIRAILDYYMGKPPVTVPGPKGKPLTPQQYLKMILQINPDEYMTFMSLLEAPFYSKAVYNVPDNWWKSDDYINVPLADFMEIIKYGVKKGYSFALGGDVSESGYLPEKDIAIVPTYDIPSEYIDDYARQFRFSNGTTTDDHAVHLIGYKENKDGYWFLIKDSGSGARNGKLEGYYRYHEDYVKLKMMTFTVHRDALPPSIKEKMNPKTK
ncbi:MAG: peptidase C1 [Bacteroidetes bacterium]|nr:MAG: peptidase C1 [Bacteroidota bacterium]